MHANHPLSLLIVVFVAFLSSASSLTLAAENNNHAFTDGDTASCGHGGRLGPHKNASPERLNEPDLRDPMKYTAVAVRSSAMNCNAELNSSDLKWFQMISGWVIRREFKRPQASSSAFKLVQTMSTCFM